MASKHCGDAPVLYSGKQGSIPWPASILLVQNIYRAARKSPTVKAVPAQFGLGIRRVSHGSLRAAC